jgi:hypothetical protein
MSAALAPLPGFLESHSSLASFYAANPRRWASREIDLGLRWRGPCRRTFRAAFVEATGELYVFEHQRSDGGGGMVFVHERVSTEWGNATTFGGWELVCGEEGSFDWLVSRANEHAARTAEGRGRRRATQLRVAMSP